MMHSVPVHIALRCLVFIFCMSSGFVWGQGSVTGTITLSEDSLKYTVQGKVWRFIPEDLAGGADTALDDRTWPLVSSHLFVHGDSVDYGFHGIGWLRLHFETDSSLSNKTLSLGIRQTGASEVYIDGRLLQQYGQLKPKTDAVYFDPLQTPLSLPTLEAGHHVLAIRYANWDYIRNVSRFNKTEAGFRVQIMDSAQGLRDFQRQQSLILFCFMLLAGIFFAFSLVHFILYLYYREDVANGRFSFMAASVAMIFLVPAVMRLSHNPQWNLWLGYFEFFWFTAAAFSLSYLLNGLFPLRRWHFRVITAICLCVVLVLLFWKVQIINAFMVMCAVVPLEALVILVVANWRRLPGARIIGGGLSLLVGLLLTVMGIIIVRGDIYLGDASVSGQIFVFLIVLAILSIPISMSLHLAWRFAAVNRYLKAQLRRVESLNARARAQESEKQRMLQSRQEELEREVALRTEELRQQHAHLVVAKKKSDDLLLNILPEEVAEELKETGRSEARLYNDVSVLFTDFVNFTQKSEHLSPAELVAEIDQCFKAFDGIITRHGLEKIKTVGDAYIAVSGLPAAAADHAMKVVAAACEIRTFMAKRQETHPATFAIRLGVHSGPVVAGIVGVKKFAYDIWGDTVNTAARMEQHSEAGHVNISAATYALVKDAFSCTYRGELEAKHKGRMGMYFANSPIS